MAIPSLSMCDNRYIRPALCPPAQRYSADSQGKTFSGWAWEARCTRLGRRDECSPFHGEPRSASEAINTHARASSHSVNSVFQGIRLERPCTEEGFPSYHVQACFNMLPPSFPSSCSNSRYATFSGSAYGMGKFSRKDTSCQRFLRIIAHSFPHICGHRALLRVRISFEPHPPA